MHIEEIKDDEKHTDTTSPNSSQIYNNKKIFFEINNISIGIPSPVHAILVTFPDNFNEPIVTITCSGLEFFIFTSTAFYIHYDNKNLKFHSKNIDLLSSTSNAFFFTYATGCKLVALITGNQVKLSPSIIATLSSILAASVLAGGLTFYRGFKENKNEEIRQSLHWRRFSKGLNSFLAIITVFSTITQVFRLIDNIKNSENKKDDFILSIIQLTLIAGSFLAFIIGELYNRPMSLKMTDNLGIVSNLLHDISTTIESFNLDKPFSYITLSSMISKPLAGLGIFSIKKCLKKPEAEEPLIRHMTTSH